MPSPRAAASPDRPRRVQLSAPLILDAAAAVVERDGPGALTLRRLGTELGVNHTAVLRHFDGKDQIVLALAARVLEEALDGFEPTGEWDAAFIQLAHRVRGAYLVHPGIASLVAARVSRSTAEFRGAELVLATFERAGFSGREAAVLYLTVTDLTLALSAYEASVLTLDAESREGDRLAIQRDYLLAPATDFPHLAAAAPELASISADEIFDSALGLVLDGIRFRRSREQATPERP